MKAKVQRFGGARKGKEEGVAGQRELEERARKFESRSFSSSLREPVYRIQTDLI